MTANPTASLLMEAMWAGNPQAARDLVKTQLLEGAPGSDLIVDLLAPAQAAVGRHWQRREWSVAEEHAATAVVDAALAVVEARAAAAQPDGPVLVLACAESEWHSLPARMAAQILRESGASVRFLGPSLPADHLREYLGRLQPDALLLSATMPTSLPGAARCIDAAHDVGVHVIAGGGAFGADATRAQRLGADNWVGDVRDLQSWTAPSPHAASEEPLPWPEFLVLQHAAPAAAAAAYYGLLVRVPALQRMTDSQAARTREDLAHILDFLAVSLLVNDERVMRDFTSWLCDVLQARGVPLSAVPASYRALAEELDPTTTGLLTELADGLAA
jgi:methanogenic corrinoid protein MtbC1